MKIVLGLDESSFSEDALQHVLEAEWPFDTNVMVVSAVPSPYSMPDTISPQAMAILVEETEKKHREVAEGAVRRLREAGLKAESRVRVGDAGSLLEETARKEKADMIVVGSHGRSGLKKLLLGSVASHVVTHAPCTTIVVKARHAAPKVSAKPRKPTVVRVY